MASVINDEGPITAINVTPLVDIILVVLIIFMATAPLIGRRAVKVDVPKAAHHERAATDALQIVLNAKREVSLSGKVVQAADLAVFLSRTVAFRPELHVTMAADQGVAYGEVVALLDLIRGAGVRKIGLEVAHK